MTKVKVSEHDAAVILAAEALCKIYESAKDGRIAPDWLVEQLKSVEHVVKMVNPTLTVCKLVKP